VLKRIDSTDGEFHSSLSSAERTAIL
jgi:hypothetical protein